MATILVADDHLAERILLKSVLSRAGHDTLLAEDGLDALEQLSRRDDIDMLLSDLDMPQLDGLGLLEKLQGRSRPIKVVITAYAKPENRERLDALGVAEVLQKPVPAQTLLELVSRLLSQGDAEASA